MHLLFGCYTIDVIYGSVRANASYFYIAKAFSALAEDADSLETVDYNVFNEQYNIRDRNARIAMKELINSEKNKVIDVFSTLL